MAARIHELRAKRAKLAKEANEALDRAQKAAEAEGRDLTEAELAAQDDFDARLEALDREIKIEERKADRARMYGSADPEDHTPPLPGAGPQPQVHVGENRVEKDPRKGFASHRDFLMACMKNSEARAADEVDERLRHVAVRADDGMPGIAFMLPEAFTPRSLLAAAGSDEHGVYADPYGGYAVPTAIVPGVRQIGADPDPTAGRTQPVPMEAPSVDILARVDKNHSTSVSGGLTVGRRAETSSINSSRMEIERITLKAAGLFGLAYETEELLTDSPISFVTLIASGFRDQFGAKIFWEKLHGSGAGEFLGVLNSPAKIQVAKQAGQQAGTITAINVIEMEARAWGNPIWLANHTTKPQLRQLALIMDNGYAGGVVSLYQPSLQAGMPDMLLGKPIFYTEHLPAKGEEGDIILVDWSQYLEGLYQPLQSAESVHVRFLNHERAFKFWLRNAGAPWWRSPLTPHKGDTLSPIVTLAERK